MATNLSEIKTDSNWGTEVPKINQNFQNVGVEIEKLKNTTDVKIRWASSLSELQTMVPNPFKGQYAYVGATLPAAIYKYNGSSWANTGQTGGSATVDPNSTYSKTDIDSQQSAQNLRIDALEKGIESLEEKTDAAAQSASEAARIATEAKNEANEAAAKAENAAAKVEQTTAAAIGGATARFSSWMETGNVLPDKSTKPGGSVVYVADAGKFAYHMDSTLYGDWDVAGVPPAGIFMNADRTAILPDKLYLLGDAVYTGTGGSLRLLAYRHEVMSGEAYEALPDKDANTLYLIYEED